ncbi:DUF3223 domain-containing protein [Streptomyces gardneri]|uniref:DUF3223 domain-containing protein n=1 Tax=Streptomyces gardneri TaxID=66892 RepID=UPI0037D280EE
MKCSPWVDELIGEGVKHFLVRVNGSAHNSNRCFWVWRQDDTYDDFSFPKCVRNAPRTQPS